MQKKTYFVILLVAFSGLIYPPISFAQNTSNCLPTIQVGGATYSLDHGYFGGLNENNKEATTQCYYINLEGPKSSFGVPTKNVNIVVYDYATSNPKLSSSLYGAPSLCTDDIVDRKSNSFFFATSKAYSLVAVKGDPDTSISLSLIQPFFNISGHANSCDGTETTQQNTSYPIIFLPGVGGSTLGYDNFFEYERLWPDAEGDTTLLFMDESGKPVDSRVKEGRILDFSLYNLASATDFYSSIMETLDDIDGYELSENLVAYPYDWRLFLDEHIWELDVRVDKLLEKNNSKKVILIAHSMGGVIAKAYAQELGKDKVEMVITIGTPYFGAVKPFYALADGYNFDNPFYSAEFMKRVSQNAPGVYHLVAPYDFVFEDGKPIDRNTFLNNVRYAALDDDLLGVVTGYYEILDENTWSPNKSILAQVNDFNSKYFGTPSNPKSLPSDVKHYVIVGTGVSTLGMYNLVDAVEEIGDSYIEYGNRKVILEPVFVDGDGTVPLTSSKFDAADKIYYVKHQSGKSAEHGYLPANKNVKDIILKLLDGTAPSSATYSCDSLHVTDSDKKSNFMIPNYSFKGNKPSSSHYYADSQGSSKSCANDVMSFKPQKQIQGSATTESQNESNDISFMNLPDMPLTEHGTINLDKEKIIVVERSIPLQIHGKAAGYQKGDSFVVVIESPNGDILEVPTTVASGGTYVAKISVEPTDPEGVYAIASVRNGEVIAKASVTVQKDTATSKPKPQVPDWVKNNAKWWAEGQIGDDSFVQGIQYLVKENVISLPQAPPGAVPAANAQVPDWVKNNAKWWAEGQIEESDFLKGIEFMAQQGIIRVN